MSLGANAATEAGAFLGQVDVKELTWGLTPLELFGNTWDLVVASDVIYRAEHVELLLETIRGVVGPATVCYIAFDRRGREGLQVGGAGGGGTKCSCRSLPSYPHLRRFSGR